MNKFFFLIATTSIDIHMVVYTYSKTYIEFIASYVHQKTGNHLRSHLRTIMALDHRRLIMLGKKIRPNLPNFFAFDKFTLQHLANKSGCV